MERTAGAGLAGPRRWPAGLAWTLWALAMLALAAVPWFDRLLRQAGRPDLTQWDARPAVALVSAVTVGAVLASRRPRHPVGWLLLSLALSLIATGGAAQYLVYGLLVRPGALPVAHYAALYYPPSVFAALALIGFVLLLTPTGSLPSPGWRWWARGMVAALVALLPVVTLAGGPLDPRYQAVRGPFEFRGFSRVVMVANQVALAVTVLGVVVAAGSLVVRFRGARGVERLQLRWVAFAAVLVSLAGVVVLAGLALGATDLLTWAASVCVALLPVTIGAAILRYRLYDLDRIISRTLAYGLLTLLLGGGYAAVALGLGQLLGKAVEPGGGRGDPGGGCGVPAGAPPRPAGGRPALQPAPLRRRPDDAGVQRSVAAAGRPGHPDRRPAGSGRPDHPADSGVAVAAAFRQCLAPGSPCSRSRLRTKARSAAGGRSSSARR
jgi:hypothetical protein